MKKRIKRKRRTSLTTAFSSRSAKRRGMGTVDGDGYPGFKFFW